MIFFKKNNTTNIVTICRIKGLLQFLGVRPAHNDWELRYYEYNGNKKLELQTPRGATYDIIKHAKIKFGIN